MLQCANWHCKRVPMPKMYTCECWNMQQNMHHWCLVYDTHRPRMQPATSDLKLQSASVLKCWSTMSGMTRCEIMIWRTLTKRLDSGNVGVNPVAHLNEPCHCCSSLLDFGTLSYSCGSVCLWVYTRPVNFHTVSHRLSQLQLSAKILHYWCIAFLMLKSPYKVFQLKLRAGASIYRNIRSAFLRICTNPLTMTLHKNARSRYVRISVDCDLQSSAM